MSGYYISIRVDAYFLLTASDFELINPVFHFRALEFCFVDNPAIFSDDERDDIAHKA